MTEQTAIIIASRVFVPVGDIETFISETQATYPIAAANPGNVLISPCPMDTATGTVTMLEQWMSEKAFDRHLATPGGQGALRQAGSAYAK